MFGLKIVKSRTLDLYAKALEDAEAECRALEEYVGGLENAAAGIRMEHDKEDSRDRRVAAAERQLGDTLAKLDRVEIATMNLLNAFWGD
jgi:hypothetical protein